jgi:REP element-mobilizing transposase RayT
MKRSRNQAQHSPTKAGAGGAGDSVPPPQVWTFLPLASRYEARLGASNALGLSLKGSNCDSLGQRPRGNVIKNNTACRAVRCKMPQSLAKILTHIIFSTKKRQRVIDNKIINDLHAYIASIIRSYDSTVYEIGGTEDHIHLFILLPRTLSLSKIVEEVKKSSSKWIKTKGERYTGFAWQRGYGAFSISESNFRALKNYIQNQKEHHKKITFQDEYRAFLKKYGIAYDERYVWD